MSERRIQCPECGGRGEVNVTVYLPTLRDPCPSCKSSGTIPERRKPTAADRAVERIKAYCIGQTTPSGFDRDMPGVGAVVLRIIREEAERG